MSNEHELTVELFRAEPEMTRQLLDPVVGDDLSRYTRIREDAAALADLTPATFHADAAFVFLDENAAETGLNEHGVSPKELAVIVEVQRRTEKSKRLTWPAYVANLRAKRKCDVLLVVICFDDVTADWSRKPIKLGHPGFVFTPVVIGPSNLPMMTDPGRIAAQPRLATLAALAHSRNRSRQETVLRPYLTTMMSLGDEASEMYADYVVGCLKQPDRARWEDFMTAPMESFVQAYRDKYEAKGEARGEAKALLVVLRARGIDVPAAARARISDCTELDQLDSWLHRAATINSIDELFT
ncbi:hypothetical protein G1H11_00365 [Phytoactinopolyspora alkaliphila]|uniref:Uncharacterized protein n=1 Tax=Phytoactinopolyspora alkaliphila TaxID=1783498 RepID=A0A6N9YFI3_9ACTN|nr:hypothetical protein [Phytoactinopolyspora alkaliphila]NED93766.1 hypothetical protein [Phytoactinopolyspora alkaliphila]